MTTHNEHAHAAHADTKKDKEPPRSYPRLRWNEKGQEITVNSAEDEKEHSDFGLDAPPTAKATE